MKTFTRVLTRWIPLAVAITGVFGFAYLAVQQNYRQSLNDPQIQMAEDAAVKLSQGGGLDQIIQKDVVPFDITTSLAPWMAVYDSQGNSFATTALLAGEAPVLPKGLFDQSSWGPLKRFTAPSGAETRVTWEPRPGVRQAVVLVAFTAPIERGMPIHTGYVAVGRSMSVVEDRIVNLTQLAALAWSVTLAATFAVLWFLATLG